MKIIILNLPRSLLDTELQKMFAVYGDVINCNIVKDDKTGKSKGFGFIEMSTVEQAEKAIKNLHGTQVLEQKIRVKISTK